MQRSVWKNSSTTVEKPDERPILVVGVVIRRIQWVSVLASELLQLLRTLWVIHVVLATFSHFAVVVPMSDGVKGAEKSDTYRSEYFVPFYVSVRSLVANSREDEDK